MKATRVCGLRRFEKNWIQIELRAIRIIQPIANFEVSLDFPAFVAVFLGLLWAIHSLPEWVFGVAHGLRNGFQGFRHIMGPFGEH